MIARFRKYHGVITRCAHQVFDTRRSKLGDVRRNPPSLTIGVK